MVPKIVEKIVLNDGNLTLQYKTVTTSQNLRITHNLTIILQFYISWGYTIPPSTLHDNYFPVTITKIRPVT